MRLFVDVMSIDPTRPAHQSVPIWWELRNKAYPADGWMDAAIVLIQLWTFAAIQAMEGAGDQKLVFMEGGYSLTLRFVDGEFSIGETNGESTRLAAEVLASELVRGNRLIERRLSALGILGEEVHRIERGVSRLSDLLKRHTRF